MQPKLFLQAPFDAAAQEGTQGQCTARGESSPCDWLQGYPC